MSSQGETSFLLTPEENDIVNTVIGHRRQSKATAVVQLYQAHPDRNSWTKFRTGVVCFVKDNIKKSYYFRLIDIGTKAIVFEQELYNQFAYKRDKNFFHSFPGDKFMVGLNFADEREADRFGAAVDIKLKERTEKRNTLKPRSNEKDVTVIDRPPVAPINDGNDPFAANSRKGRPKRPRGKKINKADIGLPSDFRHLAHVGFDPQTGAFDSDNITPEWKKLLDTVGVTNEQLEDKETAEFIYGFVEKHGGIEEANRQLEQARNAQAAPPPPSHRKRKDSRHGGNSGGVGVVAGRGAPPPPPRVGGAPPPPSRRAPSPSSAGAPSPSSGAHLPPPPPPVGVPAPPPPPPPPVSDGGGGAPPPPPMRAAGGGGGGGGGGEGGLKPSTSSDGGARSNLLSSIRAGVQLKTVTHADDEDEVTEDDSLDGMAGALARALALRSNVIQQSEESNSEESADDEWD